MKSKPKTRPEAAAGAPGRAWSGGRRAGDSSAHPRGAPLLLPAFWGPAEAAQRESKGATLQRARPAGPFHHETCLWKFCKCREERRN